MTTHTPSHVALTAISVRLGGDHVIAQAAPVMNGWGFAAAFAASLMVMVPAVIGLVFAHRRAMSGIHENKAEVAAVKESVGGINGHGSVQDATGVILEKLEALEQGQADLKEHVDVRFHGVQSSIDSVIQAAGHVSDRLKQHDREIAELKRPARPGGT